MDYGNAELCSECGENMFIIPNPSKEMIENSGGFEYFKEMVIKLTGHFDEEDIRIAFCDPCGISAIIGPEVALSGVFLGGDS